MENHLIFPIALPCGNKLFLEKTQTIGFLEWFYLGGGGGRENTIHETRLQLKEHFILSQFDPC